MTYDSREDFFLQLLVDYVLLNEILAGAYATQCLQKIGIKYGMSVEDLYRARTNNRDKLTPEEFAGLILDFFNSIGGKYILKASDDEKVILACYGCPFGHLSLKSPQLCEVFTGFAGGMAARNFSYCKVSVEQSIAQKSSHCQLVFYLAKSGQAARARGTEFHNEPTSYLLTRSEISAIKEEVISSNNVYNKYAESLESLQSIHREMETEYNQLRNEIFSDLRLGVLTVNQAGKITYLNKAAQELLSVDSHWDTQVTKEFQRLLENTLKNKTRYNQHLLHIPFPEGHRYYSVNTAPLFTEDETANGAVCVFLDITEKRMVENELSKMEKFSLVAELAAGTAHEIRNPLTTMRGFLQILSREFKPDTKGYEYCELMIEEIDRANVIIREFLLLTKPAAPKLREADLHVILEEIFLLIESKSLLENVELRKRYAKSLPLVKVDPAQIKQVFLNIASNALQSMPTGGHLTIATSVENEKAVVSFADSGHGMEDSQLAKIFDPFFTTKEQGTGLGLTISYRIIESHQGRLYATSTPGKGTTFFVELPAVADDKE